MKREKIIIVGAGLCGTLLAIRMAQRGYEIALYEKRADMRLEHTDAGRSINLALSARGLQALERVGLRDEISKVCIPMYGRMIHPLGGQPFMSRYSGRKEDYINSVSRGGLNIALLNKADTFPNLTVHFNHACLRTDLDAAEATFKHYETGEVITVKGDVVIGTDGAGSAVRKSLMSETTKLLFNYSQSFLRHGYKELSILPTAEDGWQIEKNALHIWPRGKFMIIALPNLDGSFTVTMFHPFEGENGFRVLNTPAKVKAFFEKEFAELLPYMPHYVEEFFENPTGTLGTIKCYPWQAYGRTLIMGDAAHAIVPFYGQGMNASFEDVRVFDDVLRDNTGDDATDWEAIFTEFQDLRAENADAVADLALDNFIEMQDRVDDEDFKKKRILEMRLEQNIPDYYSKYSLVTFRPDLPYKEAMRRGRAQDELLLKLTEQARPEDLDLAEVMKEVKLL